MGREPPREYVMIAGAVLALRHQQRHLLLQHISSPCVAVTMPQAPRAARISAGVACSPLPRAGVRCRSRRTPLRAGGPGLLRRRGRCKPSRRQQRRAGPGVLQRCGLPPPVRRPPPKARCTGASESCRRSSCRGGGPRRCSEHGRSLAQDHAAAPLSRLRRGRPRRAQPWLRVLYRESSRRHLCSTTGGRRRVLLSGGTVAQKGAPPAPEGRRPPPHLRASGAPRKHVCCADVIPGLQDCVELVQ